MVHIRQLSIPCGDITADEFALIIYYIKAALVMQCITHRTQT